MIKEKRLVCVLSGFEQQIKRAIISTSDFIFRSIMPGLRNTNLFHSKDINLGRFCCNKVQIDFISILNCFLHDFNFSGMRKYCFKRKFLLFLNQFFSQKVSNYSTPTSQNTRDTFQSSLAKFAGPCGGLKNLQPQPLFSLTFCSLRKSCEFLKGNVTVIH